MRKLGKVAVPLLALALGFTATACAKGQNTGAGDANNSESLSSTNGIYSEFVEADPIDVSIMALSGPTGMGMARFMKDAAEGILTDNNYSFELAGAVDEITPNIVQKKVDIAAVPANLASVLYNNTEGGVKVLAVNTLGVIYIVETGDSVNSVSDLKGKTIYASGKGATPEAALNYILKENGLDPEKDVKIEWKSEHAECLQALLTNDNAVAMLPEPFVSSAKAQNENVRTALDITKEWDKLGTDSQLITGVIVGVTDFVEKNDAAVRNFLKNYKESIDFVNENIDDAAAIIGEYGIVPEAVAKKAIPNCNIVFMAGDEMKDKLNGYLNVLYKENPQMVGGELPGHDFYYGTK